MYPERLKAIAQQFHEQQAQTQSLVRLQQQKQLEKDVTPAHSPQVRTDGAKHTPSIIQQFRILHKTKFLSIGQFIEWIN